MSEHPSPNDMGEPALRIAGFQLWVHGREFPDSHDEYDGNWLRVTAHCGASGASVWTQGSILMVTEIDAFGDECATMLRGGSRSAALEPLEPYLKIRLMTADTLGQIDACVEITPETDQSHEFWFQVDQSYLPGIIAQCSAIVLEFPVRGNLPKKGG